MEREVIDTVFNYAMKIIDVILYEKATQFENKMWLERKSSISEESLFHKINNNKCFLLQVQYHAGWKVYTLQLILFSQVIVFRELFKNYMYVLWICKQGGGVHIQWLQMHIMI